MDSPKPTLDDLRIERGGRPKANFPIWSLVIVVCVLALAAAVVWWLMRPRAIEVRTAVARENTSNGGERTVLNASGYVTARRSATASSKVTVQVVQVLNDQGIKLQQAYLQKHLDDTNVK